MASRDTIRRRFVNEDGSIAAGNLAGAIVASGLLTWFGLTAQGIDTVFSIGSALIFGPLEFFREILVAGPTVATTNLQEIAATTLAFYPITGLFDFGLGIITVVMLYLVIQLGWWILTEVI